MACSSDARTLSALSAHGAARPSSPPIAPLFVVITSTYKEGEGATAIQMALGHGGTGSKEDDLEAPSRDGTEERTERARSFASIRKDEICR